MRLKNKTKKLIISFYLPQSMKAGGKHFSLLSEFFNEKYDDLHILTVKEKYSLPRGYSLSGGGIIRRWALKVGPPEGRVKL